MPDCYNRKEAKGIAKQQSFSLKTLRGLHVFAVYFSAFTVNL